MEFHMLSAPSSVLFLASVNTSWDAASYETLESSVSAVGDVRRATSADPLPLAVFGLESAAAVAAAAPRPQKMLDSFYPPSG